MAEQTFVLITGASSGIGEATANLLAEQGKNLILLARRQDRLEVIKARLEKEHGVCVHIYPVDLTDIQNIDRFFEKIQPLSIEALVNNAGLALGKMSFEDYDWEDFNQMININIKAFTRVAQLAIPHLKKTTGHIVNISSIAGIEAYQWGSVYAASKAFVKMISKSLRIDLISTGIRVTDIAPGAVETEFATVRFKGDEQKAKELYQGYTPLTAHDIADTIAYALSRPKHVNIEYLLITCTAQSGVMSIYKKPVD